MLLYFMDAEREQIRVELSMPSLMDANGYVCQWSERNILAAILFNQEPSGVTEDEYAEAPKPEVVRKRIESV